MKLKEQLQIEVAGSNYHLVLYDKYGNRFMQRSDDFFDVETGVDFEPKIYYTVEEAQRWLAFYRNLLRKEEREKE